MTAICRRLHSFLAIVILVAVSAIAQAAPAKTIKITFVLVNDIYQMDETIMADGQRRGGFARLAAVVKAERIKGRYVVFAHAGDTISPSLLSGIDQGAHIIKLTNLIPPDVFVPGNHEFDFGKAVFFKRMAEAKFPRFAANLRGPDGKQLAGFKDRAILNFGGVRVGVTGAITTDTARMSNPEDLRFSPVVDAITQQTKELRRAGADFVVAVVHIDRNEDFALFNSRSADLILTGHDHDLFINYDTRTAMVESSSDGQYVTAIDVTVTTTETKGRRQLAWWPRFRVIDTATVRPDPQITKVVRGFERNLAKELDMQIASTAVMLDSRTGTVRTSEAAIGNLFADAVRNATGAEIAVINGGGIRANKSYPPGSAIRRRDILAELPFGNHIAMIEISGKDLRSSIENGLSELPQAAGRFPQVSGLTIEAEPRRPAGQRVISIKAGNEPLQDAKIYTVATIDFMARGGDGYDIFRDAKRIITDDDGPLMANSVLDHLRKNNPVRIGVEGRIVLK